MITNYIEETLFTGPQLELSVHCSINQETDKNDHNINLTLSEPKRGSRSLAAGIRLHGHDVTVWYKVSLELIHKSILTPRGNKGVKVYNASFFEINFDRKDQRFSV